MNRQTMVTQIVTMTTAGMVNRKEIPETTEDFFKQIKDSCSKLMKDPPTDEEINNAFSSGMPIEFSEVLAKI